MKYADAAPRALQELGLSVVDTNAASRTLVATKGVSVASWGERVALRVSSQGPGAARVQVVSKRAVATNITATNWEEAILDRIGVLLEVPSGPVTLTAEQATAFEVFKSRPYPRAFVVAGGGLWNAAWGRKGVGADWLAQDTLQRCRQMGRAGCRIYAVDGDVVAEH